MAALRNLFSVFVAQPLQELAHRPRGQVPALDALRSFAILFVVAGHVSETILAQGGSANFFGSLPFVRNGWIGVDLFFVLSGYFIGRQLWRELRDSGTVNFGRFALRRGFRIWPLFFCFILFVLLFVRPDYLTSGRWWSDPLFLSNYINLGTVRGSWSLCTEEQFYLLAPLLLVLAAPRLRTVQAFRPYLIGLLVLIPCIRALQWWLLRGTFAGHDATLALENLYKPIHTHCDGLLVGLLLSNLEVGDGARYKQGFLGSLWVVLLALVAMIGLSQVQRVVFNFTGVALVFGALLWALVSRQRRWLAFLNVWAFYLISRLSFGMYLNHSYLIDWAVDFTAQWLPFAAGSATLHNTVAFVVLTLASLAVALVTFCLIEYPFLKMRELALRRASARQEATPVQPVPVRAVPAPAAAG